MSRLSVVLVRDLEKEEWGMGMVQGPRGFCLLTCYKTAFFLNRNKYEELAGSPLSIYAPSLYGKNILYLQE